MTRAFASRLLLVCFYMGLAIWPSFACALFTKSSEDRWAIAKNCMNLRACSWMVTRSTLVEKEQ